MTSPSRGEPRQVAIHLDHLVHGEALLGERAGGADLHALSAIGATRRLSPRAVHVAHDHALDAARTHVPDVRAFYLRADAHAARAQNAAIVVEHVARVRNIDGEFRISIRIAHAGNSEPLRHGLEFAVIVTDADG